jgi:hypothetical protein
MRTLERKEGYVVLLLPVLPHEGVEFFYEQVPKCPYLTVLGDERLKPRKAEHLPVWVMGLYQAVAIEEEYFANFPIPNEQR